MLPIQWVDFSIKMTRMGNVVLTVASVGKERSKSVKGRTFSDSVAELAFATEWPD